MLRELALQAAVTSYVATTIQSLMYRIQGYVRSTGTIDYFIQMFDATTLPANGTVPLKSWQGQVNFQFIFHESEGIPVTNGMVFALSTTDATLTLVTGAGNNMDIQVEIEEYESLANPATFTTTASTGIGAGGFLQILADTGTSPSKLSEVILTPGSAQTLWLMVFAHLPIANEKPITQRKIVFGSSPVNVWFGRENGLICQSFDTITPSTIHYGMYVSLSTSGAGFVAYAGADYTTVVKYIANNNPIL